MSPIKTVKNPKHKLICNKILHLRTLVCLQYSVSDQQDSSITLSLGNAGFMKTAAPDDTKTTRSTLPSWLALSTLMVPLTAGSTNSACGKLCVLTSETHKENVPCLKISHANYIWILILLFLKKLIMSILTLSLSLGVDIAGRTLTVRS